eukprot:SAG31_NODE_1074_length_10052_cov_88.255400_3_plen_67_part_00
MVPVGKGSSVQFFGGPALDHRKIKYPALDHRKIEHFGRQGQAANTDRITERLAAIAWCMIARINWD